MPDGLGGSVDKVALSKALEDGIVRYSGCLKFPIKGEIWEEISVAALEAAGMEVGWEAGSHSSGADIWLSDLNEGISSKSGKITRTKSTGKHELSISSYRTTKYPTLKEKLDFFDGDGKNFKNYLVITREEDKKNKVRKYSVVLIDATFVNASNLLWTGKGTGWNGQDTGSGVKMKIQRSMSDQFWIYLDLNKFNGLETLVEVSIPYDQLGKTHKIVEAA
jgi:hypothetical protein